MAAKESIESVISKTPPNQRWVLGLNVELMEGQDISVSVASRLPGEGLVLTNRGSRLPSCWVDPSAASFIRSFDKPTTITDAVLSHAKESDNEPEDLLETAYPLVSKLIREGFLVPEAFRVEQQSLPHFPIGAIIAGSRIERCITVRSDTEVYCVRRPDGRLAALKIWRTKCSQGKKHESRILDFLSGSPAPTSIGQGEYLGFPYLLMSWAPGTDVIDAAELKRKQSIDAVLTLCRDILLANEKLHNLGVVHGDVHPGNIRVCESSSICILDYGCSTKIANEPTLKFDSRRFAVSYYIEPQLAQSLLVGEPPPSANILSDQYALGVLLFRVLTGTTYIDFEFEREAWLLQIRDLPPKSFEECGIDELGDVEAVIRRALSKEYKSRFVSTSAFVEALTIAIEERSPKSEPSEVSPRMKSLFVRESLRHYCPNFGQWTTPCLPPPTCSSVHGGAGVAYFLYRLAVTFDDPKILVAADAWGRWSTLKCSNRDAFVASNLGIHESMAAPSSLYHASAGVHLVSLLIARARDDVKALDAAVSAFLQMTNTGSSSPESKNTSPFELLFGTAGTLLGYSIAVEILYESGFDSTELQTAGNICFDNLWSSIEKLRTSETCAEIPYFGIAHGWAGILYAVLRWSIVKKSTVPSSVLSKLSELASVGQEKGRSLSWPQKSGGEKHWSGWCHGTAGFVYLFLAAFRADGDQRWVSFAERAGNYCVDSNDDCGGTLCCGASGIAYAMLDLHRHTGDRKWRNAASLMTHRASNHIKDVGLIPNSLYKGSLGMSLAVVDSEQNTLGGMPLFEPEWI